MYNAYEVLWASVWYRLQPEHRVLMSDVRLPPTTGDTSAVAIKEGDDIEVSNTLLMLCKVIACWEVIF